MSFTGPVNDLRSISYPKDVFWVSSGASWLVDVFDWDRIVFIANASVLAIGLELCTMFIPCSIHLRGNSKVAVQQDRFGYIGCMISSGCTQILVESVQFRCNYTETENSMFKIQGSRLDVVNSSFLNCWSDADGGVIQSYDLAYVTIFTSTFINIHSNGYGGAVAAFGSNLFISNSLFSNCSSDNGGGAVWASAFQNCYGSKLSSDTTLKIESCYFLKCFSTGNGGAVLATSGLNSPGDEILAINILQNQFINCRTSAYGGAVRTEGSRIVARVANSKFEFCFAGNAGGAISSSESASISMIHSIFSSNIAYGLGGGALHLKTSSLLMLQTTSKNNSAPFGGGGFLFWQGIISPAVIGCPGGMRLETVSCTRMLPQQNNSNSDCWFGTCIPCNAGTFQDKANSVECTSCPLGTFTEYNKSTTCTTCPAGHYSITSKASSRVVCLICEAGYYSINGSSSCSSCPAGTFSEQVGISACISCRAGHYASIIAASNATVCSECGPGHYSQYTSSYCSLCPAGTYSDLLGSSLCMNCFEGKYNTGQGANNSRDCKFCERGQVSIEGSSYCFSCRGNQITIMPASFGNLKSFPKSTVRSVPLLVADPLFACSALSNSAGIRGKAVLISRGGCQFGLKALNAQLAGAMAAIIFDSINELLIVLEGGIYGGSVTIPVGLIAQGDGKLLAQCTVNQTILVTVAPSSDAFILQVAVPEMFDQQIAPCRTGTYLSSNASACAKCPPGKFSSVVDAHNSGVCIACKEGFYSGTGAVGCSSCISGIYTNSTYYSQGELIDLAQCPPQTSLNGSIGRFSSGIGYGNDEQMFWILAPEGALNISLKFIFFDTELGYDFVKIYACFSVDCSANLIPLGIFSGSTVPAVVICPTAVMLIVWTSDVSDSGVGWKASFQAMGPLLVQAGLKSAGFKMSGSGPQLQKRLMVQKGIPTVRHQPESIYSRQWSFSNDFRDEGGNNTELRVSVERSAEIHDKFVIRSGPPNLSQIIPSNVRISRQRQTTKPFSVSSHHRDCTFSQLDLLERASLDYLDGLQSVLTSLTLAPNTTDWVNEMYCNKHMAVRERSREARLLQVDSDFKNNFPRWIRLRDYEHYDVGLDDICGNDNSAAYGSCAASDFKTISMSRVPLFIFPGIPFPIMIEKKDAYNQTIVTDSGSLLQAFTSLNGSRHESDALVTIIGPALAKLSKGSTLFSFALKPTFWTVDFQRQTTALTSPPFLYFEGIDTDTQASMLSGIMQLKMEQGSHVCPAGYVLALDQQGARNGSAVCSFCKSGTYSIHPLAGDSFTRGPSCFTCPAGGDCGRGGAEVAFDVGNWRDVFGMYVLTSCPAGYQLINSTIGTSQGVFSSTQQQCRKCNAGDYIIDPNTDTCQKCPSGVDPISSRVHRVHVSFFLSGKLN